MNHARLSWYALHVRSRFEKIVASNLSRRGFEAFLPTYKIRDRLNERHLEIPLFPSYVFCRMQEAEARLMLMIPGVMHIVGTGAGVKPVDEVEMAAVKLVVQSPLHYRPCRFREAGRRVRVAEGALHNLEGILAESGNKIGIVVGISLLKVAVLVEIGDASQVVAVSNTRTPVSPLLTAWKPSDLWNAPGQDAEGAIEMFPFPFPSSEVDRTIRCIPATIVFDSSHQASLADARGVPVPVRSLLLRTEDFDIHLQIRRERGHKEILGQILSRRRKDLARARFHLLRNGEELQAATADMLGEFNFTDVPEGDLNLQVDLPYLTIIGALSA